MPSVDTTWFTLRAGLEDYTLHEHHKCYAALHHFHCPEEQAPQLITMVGRDFKSRALRKMRLGLPSRGRKSSEVHLYTDLDPPRLAAPTLVADCELHNDPTDSNSEKVGDATVVRPLTWFTAGISSSDRAALAHMLYAKLLAPFSTVICLFADDLGGLSGVSKILALWLSHFSHRPTELPPTTYPRFFILTSDGTSTMNESKESASFLRILRGECQGKVDALTTARSARLKRGMLDHYLLQQFGNIRVVNLPVEESRPAVWRSFKGRIIRESSGIHHQREISQVAFSVHHFKSLFHLACDHFCSKLTSPFSFVRASRSSNPVPPEISYHLSNFLRLVDSTQILNFAAIIIASALAFESYPLGMHGFHPSPVFRRFFYQTCVDLDPLRRSTDQTGEASWPQFANAIENGFSQVASKLMTTDTPPSEVHRQTLSRFKDVWKHLYSNVTCLACLTSRPEDALQCRHSLCSVCTESFNELDDPNSWTFWVKSCPLCGESNSIKHHHKPDTAGVRAVITEGGGIRGIIPLTFLEKLEKVIDLPMPLQQHFDMAFGSSSGALVTLGIFNNQWTVTECLEKFYHLSSTAFRKRFNFQMQPLKTLGNGLNFLISCATDSRYQSSGINSALQSAFGDTSHLFDSSGNGTKVAIIAATISRSLTCVFANYNGPGRRPVDCGYLFHRPDDFEQELLTWEAARASTAAPTYFRSYQGYHDGGLGGHNNPINLALWEKDIIWPGQNKQPDCVLSLGTGFKRSSPDNSKISFLAARCVPRLLRSFMNFFVGESRWQELRNTLPPNVRDRYHRLNVEFYDKEPELDDIQAMPSLRKQAEDQAAASNHLQQCADNVIASHFYLKLVERPTFDGSRFVCQVKICCRIEPSQSALRVLVGRLMELRARFHIGPGHYVLCVDDTSYPEIEAGGWFSRSFRFTTTSLSECIDVKIVGLGEKAWSISNCPYNIETLVKDQGLDCDFGTKGRKRNQFLTSGPSKRVKYF